MTIETLFLLIVTVYLVLIAYGIVGARRRGLDGRARAATAALMVLIPPLGVFGALLATGDAFLIAGWGFVTLAMLVGGIAVALLTEFIARRVGA